MSRFARFALLVVAVVFFGVGLFVKPIASQVAQGSISGTVVDASGAAVPDAAIKATNQDTHGASTTTTNNSGLFKLAVLPVGKYTVEIGKQGFRLTKLFDVSVSANVDHDVGTIKLAVGAMTETVEVSTTPPVIETTQAQITNTLTGVALQQLPGIQAGEGLDWVALTIPGVSAARDNSFSNSNGLDFNVNGLRSRNNDQQIDGQNNNDNSVAGPALFFNNTDFIQEYEVTTDNFSSQYGRNSGSVVNIVTKAGSNRWHGTVSGEENNSALNTLSTNQKASQKLGFEGLKKIPRYNFEYTGATIGGPIWKDHVFVFGGFDDAIISSKGNFSTGALTPTPAGVGQMAGCFPGSASVVALQSFGPYAIGGGNPTPQNPQPLNDPATTTQLNGVNPVTGATYPGFTPNNNLGTCFVQLGGVARLLGDSTHEYDWIYRNDVVISDADRFSGRYIFQKLTPLNTNIFGSSAAGYPASVPSLEQEFLLDETHTFSSRMVNNFRASFGRTNVEFGGNTIGNTIPNQKAVANALASVVINGPNLSFGVPSGAPQGRIVNTYQLQDNWSYTRGRHQWTAGVNFTYQRSPNAFLPNLNGTYTFNDWNAFAQNVPNNVSVTLGNPILDFREYDTFLYAGDNWKLKDNLTLNLGLTWSYFGQPANLIHNLGVKQQTGPNPFWNPKLPLSATTDQVLASVKNAFGPSVGFAYTPKWGGFLTGNAKTVIRGGYRLAYDPAFYNIYLNEYNSAPSVLALSVFPTAGNLGALALPANMLGPNVRKKLTDAGVLTLGTLDPRGVNGRLTLDPHLGPDRAHEWSFGVQREISSNAAVEVRYVGNHGFNLFQFINQNPFSLGYFNSFPALYKKDAAHLNPAFGVPNGTLPCSDSTAFGFGRLNCNNALTVQYGNYSYSDYNALQTQFRAPNLFNQLYMNVAYTWSKTTDNASEIFSTLGAGSTRSRSQDILNFTGSEHGLSGIDFPQTLTISFVEHLPVFRAQHGVVGHMFGGWALAMVYYLASGQPYTPTQLFLNCLSNATCIAFGGDGSQYPFDFSSTEAARPFLSNPSAPPSSVGIFGGDVSAIFGLAATPGTLYDFSVLNATGKLTPVSKSNVRFIVNGAFADQTFGTPFGSAPRNALRDYHTNFGNLNIFKDFKFGERATLRFSTTMLNAFNHPNFGFTFPGTDPILEDAGAKGEFVGFAQLRNMSGSTLTNNFLGPTNGNRAIIFGLKVIF